ncbi:hypothetical protein KFL_001640060 [Klebsormidium nitens]|uniref:Uncharacterized protein n=1 Tax=Klebsormidium nitens TaxID=105231 RepID=A0A0U9HK66_KLENI|nr:hypothetical protein KFL_001640060 [Klebsormidium nitens]|eukprot:GAQ83831.1 hypothetical protein KFL_001640060 [Klebsormidium nitens]
MDHEFDFADFSDDEIEDDLAGEQVGSEAESHEDESNLQPMEESPSDSDAEEEEGEESLDTTAAQHRQGKDIQGIPWERMHFTRERYRETRLQQYKNYENLDVAHEELEKVCQPVTSGAKLFDFQYNARGVKSTVVHFQLRNLVWANSKHDIYVMHHFAINHWSPLQNKVTQVINLSGQSWQDQLSGIPTGGMERVQISTMCVSKNLLVAGGFHGEMVCKNLETPTVSYSGRITHADNAITNAIEVTDSPSGAVRMLTSNNDCIVRVFDGASFAILSRFSFPWAVNHTSVSPDGKLVCVVGDDPEGLIADFQTGKPVASLRGHLDFSFATAWHPDGRVFATGNQDTTTRLWDVRNLKESVKVLKGRIGAIRSLRFSGDGRHLAMVEPADFVHVFETGRDYGRCQEIDLFGEIAGVSFSPDGEALFVGVSDRTYSSLLEYSRIRRERCAEYF